MSVPDITVLTTGLGVAVLLAGVHLFGVRLRFLDGLPRSRWLSFAGGISVSYVFVHLLPEVTALGERIEDAPLGLAFLERHAYLMALVGFVAYYGVEKLAKRKSDGGNGGEENSDEGDGGEENDGEGNGNERNGDARTSDVFWFHIVSFGVYNVVVGYLLFHRESGELTALALFGLAMATHFLVNDWGLHHHHGELYRRRGRWVLAAAVLVGAVLGIFVPIAEAALALVFSFLAGGIVLNIIKEEVPEERESRFGAFAAGAALYAAILLSF